MASINRIWNGKKNLSAVHGITWAPANLSTTIDWHSYVCTGTVSNFVFGKCRRQFDRPSSLTEVKVKNALTAANVDQFWKSIKVLWATQHKSINIIVFKVSEKFKYSKITSIFVKTFIQPSMKWNPIFCTFSHFHRVCFYTVLFVAAMRRKPTHLYGRCHPFQQPPPPPNMPDHKSRTPPHPNKSREIYYFNFNNNFNSANYLVSFQYK